MSTDQERLAVIIHDSECPDQRCEPQTWPSNWWKIADAIIKAGWVSAAEVRLVQEAVWDEGWDERDNDCSEPYSPYRNNPYAPATEETE